LKDFRVGGDVVASVKRKICQCLPWILESLAWLILSDLGMFSIFYLPRIVLQKRIWGLLAWRFWSIF